MSLRPQSGQIEQYVKEDDDRRNDRMDVRHSINEAKRDLKSGKTVVDPSVFRSDGGVNQFVGVKESNGKTTIVATEKVQVNVGRPTAVGDGNKGLRDFMGDWSNGNVPRPTV